MGASGDAAREDPEHPVPDAAARLESRRLRELSGQPCACLYRRVRPRGHRRVPRVRLAQLAAEHGDRHGRSPAPGQVPRGHRVLHRRYPRPDARPLHARVLRQLRQGARAPRRAHAGHQGHVRPAQALRRQEAREHPQAGDRHPHPPAHAQHHRQPDRDLSHGGRGRRGCGRHRHRPAGQPHEPAVDERRRRVPARSGARHRL